MKSKWFLALLFLAFSLFALKIVVPARAEPASDAQIKRGQYLVNEEEQASCQKERICPLFVKKARKGRI